GRRYGQGGGFSRHALSLWVPRGPLLRRMALRVARGQGWQKARFAATTPYFRSPRSRSIPRSTAPSDIRLPGQRESQPCTSQISRNMNTPANTPSLKKWAPAAIRSTPTAAPKASAAAVAGTRHGAGRSIAGASVQNAPDGSPAMNEQFFGQSPRGSHHGRQCSSPPDSTTSIGRGRPQLSLRPQLPTRP